MPAPSTLPGFPLEALPVFERLLALDLQPREVLADHVDRHLQDLEAARRSNEFLDLDTARRLARVAHRLLSKLDGADDDHRRLVQAAVLYFVLEHDALPDSRGLLGLADDEAVLHSVTRHQETLSERVGLTKGFPNPGDPGGSLREALRAGLRPAVKQARRHMLGLRGQRAEVLRPMLQEDEQRVQAWFERVKALVEERRERYRTAGGTVRSDQQKRLESELAEADKRTDARTRWIEQGMQTVEDPYLKLAAVLVGEAGA